MTSEFASTFLSVADRVASHSRSSESDAFVFARESEVAKIARLVLDGRSVEVPGARWSGRTEVLSRVEAQLRKVGRPVVVVRGVGGRLPLEAVRSALPLLRKGAAAPETSPSGLLATIAEIKPSAILIDDSDQLDDASWTLIKTAHKMLRIPLVCTTLHHRVVTPDDHVLIAFARPVTRLALEPLSMEMVHDLLEGHLGGTVSPSLSGRIHTMSGGVPGFVLAIADAAASAGGIRLRGSHWVDGPDLWSTNLDCAYEALLFSYGIELREALEMMSLAGTCDLITARAVIGQEMIETLEQNALLRIFTAHDRTLIAVNPPGIADYFRHQPLTAHRLRIIESITETLDSGSETPEDAVQRYLRGLPILGPSQSSPAVETALAARMFSESFRVESAAALHEWKGTRGVPAAVRVLGLQLTGPHDAELVQRVVGETTIGGSEPRDELAFRYLHSRWLLMIGAPTEEILEPLRVDPQIGFEFEEALDTIAIAVRMEREGIPRDYVEQLSPRTGTRGIGGDLACLVLAFGHLLSGRGAEALSMIETRRHEADPFLSAQFEVAYGMALYGTGQLTTAAEWASERIDRSIAALDRMAVAGHVYVAVIALAALGRFDDAMEASRIVLSARVQGAILLFASDRATTFVLATVALRLGRNTVAEGLLERAEEFPGLSRALPFGDREFVVAATAAAGGDTAKAGGQYRALGETLADVGYQLASDSATMLSLIANFDSDLAREFRPRADLVGGHLYGAYLDGREASLRENPEELVRAARILRAQHAGDEALRFFTQAVTIYRDAGVNDKAEVIREEVRALLANDDSIAAWVDARVAAGLGLTPRESELVGFIGAGLNNSEMARRFGISVRTIETHLRNIRKKTGAISREDIAAFDPERARFTAP